MASERVLEKGIKHIKDQVADWEKKRREEEAKKKQILDYINGELSARLQQLYNEADTLEKSAEALKYITERFPFRFLILRFCPYGYPSTSPEQVKGKLL